MLDQKIREVLFNRCKVIPGQRILVGFSGGADSLCLLHLLKNQPVEIIAAHFDHNLRAESAADAAKCRKTAENWGVAFIEETGRVREFAADNKLSLEEAARMLRYRFLFAMGKVYRADAVTVAHHADDQVETVLMHLLRGAGTGGLAGMQVRARDPLGESNIPLIRPLLGVWRAEISHYCQENQLTPLNDTTNLDPAYFRNRIRHELIPNLESYNPEFKQHLWQAASVIAEENARLEDEAAESSARAVVSSGSGWVLVNTADMHGKPLWLMRRLVRKLIFGLKSTLRDVSFAEVDRAVDYLATPAFGKTCQVTDEIEIIKYDNRSVLMAARNVRLVDLWPQLDSSDCVELGPGMHPLQGGWQLTLQPLDNVPQIPTIDNLWTCLLDADKLILPLMLDIRRPGDILMPLGLNGKSLKLGDFFTNEHLPNRARDAWPLVRSSDQIAWVPGYRPAEFCKITPATRHALECTLVQIKNKPA